MSKQEEILRSALLLFTEYGFHATPTSKIAREAKVATGTLFYYYKTKDTLILDLYSTIMLDQEEYIYRHLAKEQSLEEMFRSYFRLSLKWFEEKKSEFGFIQQFQSSTYSLLIKDEEVRSNRNVLLELIKTGIKANALKNFHETFIYSLINSHIVGVGHYLHSTNNIEDNENIINISTEIFWDMIRKH